MKTSIAECQRIQPYMALNGETPAKMSGIETKN